MFDRARKEAAHFFDELIFWNEKAGSSNPQDQTNKIDSEAMIQNIHQNFLKRLRETDNQEDRMQLLTDELGRLSKTPNMMSTPPSAKNDVNAANN